MSHNQDDPIEGLSSRRGASGMSRGMEQWQAYLDQQDALDAKEAEAAAEEEARAGRIAGPAEGQVIRHAVQAIGDAAGAAVSGAAAAGPDRFGVMAAMQAEALARLELPAHVDNVNAAVRTAGALDEGTQVQQLDEFHERRFDGEMLDREQQRGVDSLAKPDDLVGGVEKHETRSAEERQDDRDHHRGRR